jgi:P27 family predicted phage terminase small subunit
MPRPRKPAAVLSLSGTLRADRHAKRHLAPDGGAPLADMPPPEHLTPRQTILWREVLAAVPVGLATRADRFAVAAYAQCLDAYREAMTATAMEGTTARGSQGQPVPSAHFRVAMMALDRLHLIGSRLGLDPQSRLRLADGMPEAPATDDEGDPWSGFAIAEVGPRGDAARAAARRKRGDA